METSRKRLDRAGRTRLLKKWTASGESARVFAERNDVSSSSLYTWKKRYKGEGAQSKIVDEGRSFVPVVLRANSGAPSGTDVGFVVELARGRRIEVPPGFDGGDLRRLIAVLEGPGC
jgi:hypothetical protein